MSNSNPKSPSAPVRLEIPLRSLSRRHFIYTTAVAASSVASPRRPITIRGMTCVSR